MDKEFFLDRLKRGLEMEEVMEGLLVDLTQVQLVSSDVPKDVQNKIYDTFSRIKNDTIKHKQIVAEIINKVQRTGR
ncbi:MAG: hypothetical protein PHQ96_08340 [Candidatus Omnitrophica bacterium]|nr:hypothetical protein [Candidatus Omnitrophota bacterium]